MQMIEQINGALNIIKKVFPDAFIEEIEGMVLYPYSVNIIS